MKAKLELNGRKYEVEIGDEVVERIESKVWVPELGEAVFQLISTGTIVKCSFVERDRDFLELGLTFQNREQAEKYRTWLKWIAEVRRWNVANNNVGEKKICLFDFCSIMLIERKNDAITSETLLFVSREMGNKFIRNFGEEKIIEMMKLQQEIMEMA